MRTRSNNNHPEFLCAESLTENRKVVTQNTFTSPLALRVSLSGMDHLLFSGRGAGGSSEDGEAAELHVACFMGLMSFLASRPEVLRVATRHRQGLLNSAARANIQSATLTDTPFTDAGLDGTGQVIQVTPRPKHFRPLERRLSKQASRQINARAAQFLMRSLAQVRPRSAKFDRVLHTNVISPRRSPWLKHSPPWRTPW